MEKQEDKRRFLPDFAFIDCEAAFKQLESTQKKYAYYLTKFAWEASKICYFQKSYESPILYYIFTKILSLQTFSELQNQALTEKIALEDFHAIMVYIGRLFNNCGNYFSQGNCKFTPLVDETTMYRFLKSCKPFSNDNSSLELIWYAIKSDVFSLTRSSIKIGLASDDSGRNSYYSSNITKEEATMVQRELDLINLSALNTRLVKVSDFEYKILIASIESSAAEHQPYLTKVHKFDNEQKVLKFAYGDYSPILAQAVKYLELSKNYTENIKQATIINLYINYLYYGDVTSHKKAQELWVTDQNPIIETNLGFIETYVDPIGTRGEWECFVMLKNIQQSKRFNSLAQNGESLLKLLPWPKAFEIDTYKKPDFNSVDVLTLASTGVPIGKNLPNYEDVRQNYGYKNLNLGNCYSTPKATLNSFVTKEEEDILNPILNKYSIEAQELKVGLHELLGHGSGKLFAELADGSKNFNPEILDPLTNLPVAGYYKSGQTWGSKFGQVSNAYEECRADAIALYLMCNEQIMNVFYPNRQDEWKDIVYVAWYNELCSGIRGLNSHSDNRWGSPHAHGRFVILQVLLQQKKDIVNILVQDGTSKSIKVTLNKELIYTHGKDALGSFLLVNLLAQQLI